MMSKLLKPVDASSVAVFRVSFGLILLWQCYRYWANDWIGWFYKDAPFLFKFYGFSWVHPPPGNGVYWVFAGMAACAALITIGYRYRLAIIGFLILFTYVFLWDSARYLNHFYLVILIAFLLCFVPASNAFSIDAQRWKLQPTIPQWTLWALVAMFEIMLLYAGLVKINTDWLNSLPLSIWFAGRSALPIIGPTLEQPVTALIASYSSIALHLIGAPLLLWHKARLTVFCIYAAFHGANAILFNIGIFPILTLAGTTLFFRPDWPRRVLRAAKIQLQPTAYPATAAARFSILIVMLFLVVQLLLPLRHFLYPGNVMWTDEGHRFSWRMKLREKNGIPAFYVRDPDTERLWTVQNDLYLKPRQIAKVGTRPDLALQFAHHIAAVWRDEKGVENPHVRAWIATSLNNRPPALLIDPTVNLAEVTWDLRPSPWIMRSPTPIVIESATKE